MRPDMMIVKLTDTEQHNFLPHDAEIGSRLPNLPPTMPSGKTRKIMILEEGLLQRCLIFGTGQGERTATYQARESTEAMWI